MGPSAACLLCGRPIDRTDRRRTAFGLIGIPAHAACCGLDQPATPGTGQRDATPATNPPAGRTRPHDTLCVNLTPQKWPFR
jgi:hypothetical protein